MPEAPTSDYVAPLPDPNLLLEASELVEQAYTRASGAPRVEGNAVRILKDGAANFTAWFAAIRATRKTVSFVASSTRHDCGHCTHQGRHPGLAVAGAGVVMAAAFCGMRLPRNSAATSQIRPTAASTTTTKTANRLPRPISVLLTITSIDGSLSMEPICCIDCADRGPRRSD